MVSRRLVNLAMRDSKKRMFSLHRMDLSKLLFYPSTAEAEAAGSRGRVGKGGKPPKIGKLRLPPPIMGFEPSPTCRDPSPLLPYGSMFVPLHSPRGRSSILFTSRAGQASMYDADSRIVTSVPDLTAPAHGYAQIIPIVTTGAGAGEESLYLMRRPGGPFEVLDFSGGGDKDKSRGRASSFSMNYGSLRWQSLPPLPVQAADDIISSFTVVDSDRIICVSAAPVGSPWQGSGTFCFDTVSQEWWQAGDWDLPFQGRAARVPELGTWLGFSRDHPHHLCAADLSGVAMAPRQGPTLQHVWEDYNPPPTEESSLVLNEDYPGIVLTRSVDWSVIQLFLVNLGAGRFCVAKVVRGEESVSLTWSMDTVENPMGTLTVLTGVEVIRDGRDGDGELRMVKHKSRQLVHPGLRVACVL